MKSAGVFGTEDPIEVGILRSCFHVAPPSGKLKAGMISIVEVSEVKGEGLRYLGSRFILMFGDL